jgi:hypothetical protein
MDGSEGARKERGLTQAPLRDWASVALEAITICSIFVWGVVLDDAKMSDGIRWLIGAYYE